MGFRTLIHAALFFSLLPWGCNRHVSTWSLEVVPLGERVVRSEVAVKKEVLVRPRLSSDKRHLLQLQVTRVKHCEGWRERAYREDRVEHHIDPHEGNRGYTCLLLPAAAALAVAGGVMLGAGLSDDQSTAAGEDEGKNVAVGGGILLGLGVAMVALCPIDLFWPASEPRGRRRQGAVYTKKGKPFNFICGREPYAGGPLEVELPTSKGERGPAQEWPRRQRRTNLAGIVELDLVRWLAETGAASIPPRLQLMIEDQRLVVQLPPELRSRAASLIQQTRRTIAAKETQDFTVELGGPGRPLLHRVLIQCSDDLRLHIIASSVSGAHSPKRAPLAVAEVVATPPYALDWRGGQAALAPPRRWIAGTNTVTCERNSQGVLQVRAEPGVSISLKIRIKAAPL